MRVIVFGAAGKTGQLTAERAQAAGHDVTAFVHTMPEQPLAGVRYATGDITDADTVTAAVADQDAVIETVGTHTPYKDQHTEEVAAANIIRAMKTAGAKRLVVVSMLGVGDSRENTPAMYRYLLQPTYLRGADADKTAMEQEVQTSGLDYVLVRPPVLNDDEPTGKLRVIDGDEAAHKITRGDLASFLVEQLSSAQFLGKAVVVANS